MVAYFISSMAAVYVRVHYGVQHDSKSRITSPRNSNYKEVRYLMIYTYIANKIYYKGGMDRTNLVRVGESPRYARMKEYEDVTRSGV